MSPATGAAARGNFIQQYLCEVLDHTLSCKVLTIYSLDCVARDTGETCDTIERVQQE